MLEATTHAPGAIIETESTGVTLNTCDTLTSVYERADDIRIYKSLFEGHSLQVEHLDAILRKPVESHDWVFGVILALVLLIFVYLRNYRIPITELVKAAFDSRVSERILRENNLSHRSSMIPIAIIYIGTISLTGYYMISKHTHFIETTDAALLGGIVLVVTIVHLLQNALTHLFGASFQCTEATHEYLTNNYLFRMFASIIILPLLLLLFFSPRGTEIFLYTVLATGAVFFILRLIRGAQIILTIPNGSKFYLFYYLCTLELAPLLILAKGIKSYILEC